MLLKEKKFNKKAQQEIKKVLPEACGSLTQKWDNVTIHLITNKNGKKLGYVEETEWNTNLKLVIR